MNEALKEDLRFVLLDTARPFSKGEMTVILAAAAITEPGEIVDIEDLAWATYTNRGAVHEMLRRVMGKQSVRPQFRVFETSPDTTERRGPPGLKYRFMLGVR